MSATDRPSVTLGRRIVPPVCITLATLLHLARLPMVEWLSAAPALNLIAIYYWTLARPNRVPFWLLFVLGLIADSISTAPLGVHALLYFGGYLLARMIRRRMESPSLLPMWGVFAPWLLVLLLGEWLLAGWQREALPPLGALPLQWIISIFFYPLLHLLFDRVLTYGQRWRL